MGKLMTFLITAAVIDILLTVVGVTTSTGYLLNTLGLLENPQGFNSSALYITILAAIGALLLVGAVSILGTGIEISHIAVAVPVALVLGSLIGDFMAVITAVGAQCPLGSQCRWAYYVVAGIMIPVILGFALSLFDWARGNDS